MISLAITYAGAALGAEDHGDRALGQVSFFDLFIFIDSVKGIHLLSLVLMETLDLNVKNRIRIDIHILGKLQIIPQFFFGMLFDLS